MTQNKGAATAQRQNSTVNTAQQLHRHGNTCAATARQLHGTTNTSTQAQLWPQTYSSTSRRKHHHSLPAQQHKHAQTSTNHKHSHLRTSTPDYNILNQTASPPCATSAQQLHTLTRHSSLSSTPRTPLVNVKILF